MIASAPMRAQAEGLGAALPALLAQAQQLAASLAFGAHGRRRAGPGDEFWQYRPAASGDSAAAIDWRRSAKTDAPFVRQREWQALNRVALWADAAPSMQFASQGLPSKANRAQLLALALAAALLRGGEKVGWAGGAAPKSGRGRLDDLMVEMVGLPMAEDYGAAMGAPESADHIVYLSDFLGPVDTLRRAMTAAADRGVRGALVQVLDPVEEGFPFSGRTVFLSMGQTLRHETQSAGDLRARYLARLATRRDELASLSRALGWRFHVHHTDKPALGALIWLHHAVSGAMG